MNILKKAAACLAAAAVMTSVAVTASADYLIGRADPRDGSGRGFCIMGLPDELKSYVINAGYVNFSNSEEECEYSLMFLIDRTTGDVFCEVAKLNNGSLVAVDEDVRCEANNVNGYGDCVFISFSENSGWFEKFSEYGRVGVGVAGMTVKNDQTAFDYFSSTGEPVEQEYIEWTSFDWGLSDNNSESSEATSGYVEPEESEPASSEPVSEPASSDPVSEPASSETSSSPSTNVDTGVTGIAAVVGTALLAVGAVIVSRKK